jgi:hypothetical protein
MFDGDIVGRVDRFGVNKTKPPLSGITDLSSSKSIISSSKGEDESPPQIIILPADYDYSIKVDTSTIKSLGKLNNLSINGTIKMYMEYNTPFKMIANIGSYGRLTIYLRDISLDQDDE